MPSNDQQSQLLKGLHCSDTFTSLGICCPDLREGKDIDDINMINSKSLIEHDCSIRNHVHISTGSIINGSATVGSNSFIGSGSVIKNNLLIKPGSFIKMGSILKK